jgi:hypothetical protein
MPRPPPTRIVLMFKPVQEIPTDQNPLSILVKMTPRHSSKTQCSLFLEVHTFEAGSFYFIWVFRYVGFWSLWGWVYSCLSLWRKYLRLINHAFSIVELLIISLGWHCFGVDPKKIDWFFLNFSCGVRFGLRNRD